MERAAEAALSVRQTLRATARHKNAKLANFAHSTIVE
jgi:hypothetical protein